MIKEKLCEEKIIKTAFSEWGKNGFRNPTLKNISDKLNLTKSALYRYFKSKDEILNNMTECFLGYYKNISNLFIDKCSNIEDIDHVIKLYITTYISFFAKNHYYFFFFIFYVIKNDYFNNKNMQEIDDKENKIFFKSIKNSSSIWLKSKDVDLLKRFIYSTIIFVLIYKFRNKKTKFIQSVNDKETEKLINDVYYIITNGFAADKIKTDINFKKIESIAELKIDDLPERDKIIDAVATVIAEEGIWNTTLSKISEKLGIVKSSLYFYFKNKKEMLSKAIVNEIEKNNELIISKIINDSTYEEKLYSLMVTFSSYLLLDKKMLKIFDWLHQQGVNLMMMKDIENSKKFDTQMIEEGITKNYLSDKKFNIEFISAYFKIQIIKEIFFSELTKREVKISDMRNIYKLFLNGIREVKE